MDTLGVDEMITQDENTLAHLQALISEESKDRNLLSPPEPDCRVKKHQYQQVTDISSSSMKVETKYEHPKYLTMSFSMDEDN